MKEVYESPEEAVGINVTHLTFLKNFMFKI